MPGPGGLLAVCLAVALIAVVGNVMRIGNAGRTWGPFPLTFRTAMARLSSRRGPGSPDASRNDPNLGRSRLAGAITGRRLGSSSSKKKKSTDQSDYDATSFHDDVIDVAERREIARILPYLEDDERVLVVARQSRVLPGATLVFTPNVVFCTARRVIIRNPMMLGLREHIDYYRHRDVKSVRLIRGRFTSSLMLTVPGMGTAARSSSGDGDGIIKAIPHEKAAAIYRIIQGGGRDGRNNAIRGNRRKRRGGDDDDRSSNGSSVATGGRGNGQYSSGSHSGHGRASRHGGLGGMGAATREAEAAAEVAMPAGAAAAVAASAGA